jgi:serine protease
MASTATLSALAVCAAIAAPAALATDIHVPADQPTVQQAIVAAQEGDRVLVDPGTYPEHIDFLGKNIEVRSTAGAAVTILDGTHSGCVVTIANGETRAAVLSGFTVRNGKTRRGFAGGIDIENASPTISDNDIVRNDACVGAGLFSDSGSPRIVRNRFSGNRATCNGGGLAVYSPVNAVIEGNLFEHNDAQDNGAGMTARWHGRAVIAGNVFRHNTSIFSEALEVELTNARVVDNVVVQNPSGGLTIGDANAHSVIVLVNNTVADNGHDEAFFEVHGLLVARNNVFRSTVATRGVGCLLVHAGRADFSNNLVFGASPWGDCDLEGGGLIVADPEFLGGDGLHAYWLSPGSPAIDVGDDAAAARIRVDASGAPRIENGTVDLGAYEFRVD